MATIASDADSVGYRLRTATSFGLDGRIDGDGFCVDIRRYAWDRVIDSTFQLGVFYVEYALTPREGVAEVKMSEELGFQPPGQVVFYPAGITFEAHCEPSRHRTLCIAVSRERADRLRRRGIDLDGLPACNDVRNMRVQRCLARLAEEITAPGFADDLLVESLCTMLMVEIYRHLGPQDAAHRRPDGQLPAWRLRRLQARIEGSVGPMPSIADLAAEMGLSARHLVRIFKNTTGMTLGEYIAGVWLERARNLLLDQNMQVKEIAGQCGFQNPAAFSAAFRNATGQTPRQFRLEARGLG